MDAIGLGVMGGEQQDAAGLALLAQGLQHFEAVYAWQADIQDDEVVVFLGAGAQREFAGGCMVHGIS